MRFSNIFQDGIITLTKRSNGEKVMLELLGFIALIAIIFGVSMTAAVGIIFKGVLWFIGACVFLVIIGNIADQPAQSVKKQLTEKELEAQRIAEEEAKQAEYDRRKAVREEIKARNPIAFITTVDIPFFKKRMRNAFGLWLVFLSIFIAGAAYAIYYEEPNQDIITCTLLIGGVGIIFFIMYWFHYLFEYRNSKKELKALLKNKNKKNKA